MNKQTLLEHLKTNCRGRNNAVTGEELRKLFGCKNIREIQKAVEQLREEFYPVLSFDQGKMKGYCWAVTREESEECLHQLESRASHTFRTWWHLKQAVDNEFSQQTQIEEFKIPA
jgi:gamma-glutamylcyclotransferase (GGCT)/AIG2-like uncharacterized protein YtfP